MAAYVAPKDRVVERSTSNSQTVFAVTGAIDTSYNAFNASMAVGDWTYGAVFELGVAFKSGKLTYSNTNEITVDSAGFESKGTFSSGGTKEIMMGMPASSARTLFDSAGISPRGLFYKSDATIVAWLKTGAFAVSTAVDLQIDVNDTLYAIPASTAIVMPGSPAPGDYAIWAKTDGSLEATSNFVTPPTTDARQVGGFHYAPGGNATSISKAAVTAGTTIGAQTVPINTWALYLLSINAAGAITVTPAAANATTGYASEPLAVAAIPAAPASNSPMGYVTVQTKTGTTFVANTDSLAGGTGGNVANATNYYSTVGVTLSRGSTNQRIASTAFIFYLGGDTTPAINAYSLWDLKWRPSCADPRGMALIAGRFWCDIYLLGVDHYANGTSRYNVTIADGSSPPKIPAALGGDGSKAYGEFNWWDANEVMQSAGKDLLSYAEFAAAAYGTTEYCSSGSDPTSTILTAAYTSKWGLMLSTGNMWVWGKELGGPYAAAGWMVEPASRGQTYDQPNAVIFGGLWVSGAISGSRASLWLYAPSLSFNFIGARGRCDHLHHV